MSFREGAGGQRWGEGVERETGSEKHRGASLEAQGDTDRHGLTVVRCDWSEQG